MREHRYRPCRILLRLHPLTVVLVLRVLTCFAGAARPRDAKSARPRILGAQDRS